MRVDSSRYVAPRGPRRVAAAMAVPLKWSVREDASADERISRVIVSSMLVVFSAGMALGAQQTVLSGGGHVVTNSLSHETVDFAVAGSTGWLQNRFFANMNTAAYTPSHVLEYIWMPYQYCAYAGAYVAAAATEYVEYLIALAKACF